MLTEEIATKRDLQILRDQLRSDFVEIVNGAIEKPKQWLKSSEVKAMLKISSNTLQSLRIKGLKARKLGGVYYYSLSEIEQMLK